MDKLTLKSYAKLNLYLQVLDKRPDNYHNIKTLFERIDLFDTITLKRLRDKSIRILCSDPLVPRDSSNLCHSAARLLQGDFADRGGIEIRIVKRIPVGAGLAGGSSNAAAVLLGLNKIWRLRLSSERLCRYAGRIGSDLAFFLYDAPFALGEGRGTEIKPLELQGVKPLWHILVVPRIVLSTRLAYKKWDELKNLELTPAPTYRRNCKKKLVRGLTKSPYNVNILRLALKKGDSSLIGRGLFNSLEVVSEKMHPEIRRVKEELVDLGLKSILMSGSGPAVFGVVSSRKEALTQSRQLKRKEKSWRVFVTGTKF